MSDEHAGSAPPPANALPPGIPPVLGGLKITRLLGEGGSARVFAAIDEALGRKVAIKILHPEALKDETRVQRFVREGRAMAKIASPYVAAVYQVGTFDGGPYLVMELLEGEDLESHTRRTRGLAVLDAMRIMRDAARGLGAAHAVGIIHRDVKPANIIVVEGRAKLTDFGLARRQDVSSELTHEGLVAGTPAFLAPERARGQGDDLRSDIYSLGATIYTLIAGEPPFVRDTPIDTITAHLQEEPVPLAQRAPHVPAGVSVLITAMMQKDPDKRPQDYDALLARIDPILKELNAAHQEDAAGGHSASPRPDPREAPLAEPSEILGATSVTSSSGAKFETTGVMGTLRQMSAIEIVQMLELSRKTAVIEIHPQTGEPGEFSVEDGQVRYAQFGDVVGEAAFYKLARLSAGMFRIHYGRHCDVPNIDRPTQFLMLEAARGLDDERTQKSVVPSAVSAVEEQAVHSPPPSPPAPEALIDEDTAEDSRVKGESARPRPLPSPDAQDAASSATDAFGARPTLITWKTSIDGSQGDSLEYPTMADAASADGDSDPESVFQSAGESSASAGSTDESSDQPPARVGSTGAPGSRTAWLRGVMRKVGQAGRATFRAAKEGLAEARSHDGAGSDGFDDGADKTDQIKRPALYQLKSRLEARWAALQPRLQKFSPKLAGLAERVRRRLVGWAQAARQRPVLLTIPVGLSTFVIVLVVGLSMGSDAPPPSIEDQLAGRSPDEVLAAVAKVPVIERTGLHDFLQGQALLVTGDATGAAAAFLRALEKGVVRPAMRDAALAMLDTSTPGAAIDILVRWPDPTVEERLLERMTSVRWWTRKNAITVLEERGVGHAIDVEAVAILDLLHGPTCADRRRGLLVLKKASRSARAREAVRVARRHIDKNDCMKRELLEMMPVP